MATATNLILLTTLLLTAFAQHAPSTQQHVHMDFQTFEPEVSDVPELSAYETRMLIMYRNTTTQEVPVTTTTTPSTTTSNTTTTTTPTSSSNTTSATTNNTATNLTSSVNSTNSNMSSTTTNTSNTTTNTNTVNTAATTNNTDSASQNKSNTNNTNTSTNATTTTTTADNTTTTPSAVNTSTANTNNTSATTPVVNTSTATPTANATTMTSTVNNTTSSSTNTSTTSSTTNTTTNNTTSNSATSTTAATITNNNIRIAVDYQHWTETKYASYIQDQLVPAVVSYFEAALKVKNPLASKIVSTAKTLCGFATPKILTTGGVDADLFIFFNNASNTYSSWVGATTICSVSSGVRRPMIINIGLNLPYLSLPTADSPLNHDLNINVLMHEFIHGLGLNGAVYNYFVDSNGKALTNHVKSVTLSGTSRTVLDLPILTAKLRNYYGCSTIPGLFIENDGTSHPENRFFQWDIMASGGIIGSRVSELNLAFLEGTGWYEADYSYAEPYFFGQGQGCDFYSNGTTASKFSSEYCTGTGIGCTELGESGGYCVTTSALENFRVYTGQPLFNCENPSGVYYVPFAYKQVYGRGLGSKCFTGNLTTYSSATQSSYCLKYTCEGSGVNTKLNVMWGTTNLTCTQEGPLSVSGFLGKFNCPDPLTYCNTVGKTFCRKNCLGRGKCVDGQCLCDAGFTGTDCGMTTDFQ